MLTNEELDEGLKLETAALKGPWKHVDEERQSPWNESKHRFVFVVAPECIVKNDRGPDYPEQVFGDDYSEQHGGQDQLSRDLAFAAWARNNVRSLIEEVKKLREDREYTEGMALDRPR